MDERVKEIESALKNAVRLDTGSKERGPIVAFHRDDITYLLNCIQRIPELEEELAHSNKLHEEYEQLLVDEINDLVGLAVVHGWKSHRADEGDRLRKEIAQLKLLNQTRKEG